MKTSEGGRRVRLVVEVAVGSVVGAAAFTLVAVLLIAADSEVLAAIVGVVCIAAVVAVARVWGVAYAAPAAIASLVAYDWFQFPPTHPHAFPATGDLATLIAYIAVAVLIGELAAHSARRADVTEVARSDLSDEQAALRRVATLVARGASPDAVFANVAEEVGELLGVDRARVVRYSGDDEVVQLAGWSAPGYDPPGLGRVKLEPTSIAGEVSRTGRAARIDDYEAVDRALPRPLPRDGARAGVGAPIFVDGRLWGAMAAWLMRPVPLPVAAEARLADFTELIATAISNTASREELARLADEQAALRRVATLVARGAPPPDVFAAVAREVGLLLGVDATHMGRYELDGTATGVAAWSSAGDHAPAGNRVDLEGERVAGLVWRTGRPARMHGYENGSGPAAAVGRGLGVRSSVGAPIVVDRRLWGMMIASSKADRKLPVDAESRIAAFTELVATAISNTEARAEVARLAEEQAALRRVATLVARAVPPSELFAAVGEEVGRLVGADLSAMVRYESDDTVTAIASWATVGEPLEVGSRCSLEEADLAATVARTRQASRTDAQSELPARFAGVRDGLGVRSSVASPIVVEGQVWGALYVHSTRPEPLAGDTETRLSNFTDLVATAVSNAHSRAEVHRLADEQAALRRVATLVAREASASTVFASVAEEAGRLLSVEGATLIRYEPDGTASVVASWGDRGPSLPDGTRMSVEGENISGLVLRTGRPARIDDYTKAAGSLGTQIRDLGVRSAVGCPIVVGGRLWGALVARSRQAEPLPAHTESRIAEFSELVATAIANIEARSELAASRARIVAATDEERRRVVRDLHDGAQQRLVHTIITLTAALRAVQNGEEGAPALMTEALDHAKQATVELRELAHGILPAILTHRGLGAGVEALASRMPVPVEIGVSVDRLPGAVEATAYFVVAEALTNVAKHAHAGHVEVTARIEDAALAVQVRDDGVGGARPDGSGLIGLADRLAVLDGRLRVESPADGGTLVAADIPLPR